MRYIYLQAYTCRNLGDDMFINLILKRYPNIKFYLFSNSKMIKGFENNKNLRIPSIVTQYTVRILRKIRFISPSFENEIIRNRAIALVWIGGSIFIESPGWEQRIHKSWYHKKNVFYISSNFGPYETEYFKKQTSNRISAAKDCCFRDTYSLNEFEGFDNVRYAPDALFSYPYDTNIEKGNGVAISVINFKSRRNLNQYYHIYKKTLIEFCKCCQSLNIPVTLVAFCIEEGDQVAIEELLLEMSENDMVKSEVYNGNIQSMLDCLGRHEFIIATRFHAMIIGWSLRKKVFPIIYSEKQINVLNDLMYTGDYWSIYKGEDFKAKDILSSLLSAPLIDNDKLKVESERQFDALDSFLASNGII